MLFELIDRLSIWWLDRRIDRAVESNPELKEFKLKRLDRGEWGWELLASSPSVPILAEEAARLLDEANAENYIQFDMLTRMDRRMRPIRVTVQWAKGESPAKRAARLEAELQELRAQ